METGVLLLGIAGFVAVLMRIVAAAWLALRGGVDAFVARDVADTRIQRGDITGSQEALTSRALARRRRLSAMGLLLMWGVLLLAPPLTPWPQLLYASYSLLWLLPRHDRTTRAR